VSFDRHQDMFSFFDTIPESVFELIKGVALASYLALML
jgi:hypothetical protein